MTNSRSHGLSNNEAQSRLEQYGPNKVKGAEGLSMWKILMRQISNSLTFVLIIVMAISFAIGDFIEGGVITAVIVLNIVVGFWQDYRAEKTIESLKKLTAPEATVTRNGTMDIKVKATDLVPGDIVQLCVGSIVPADLRLIDGVNACTNEAFLTGESIPVEKTPLKKFDDADIPTGDRTNLAFSGSEVTAGRCRGIVVATAMETEVGQIAAMLRQKKDQREQSQSFVVRLCRRFVASLKTILGLVGTPLQITLSKFALLLFGLAILLAIIVFSASRWQVGGEVLIYGICVAVAVIPESLIAVLTITIAVGGKAMAKANVITRVQSAIEAVGGVTNICSDKTGTLTQGRMVSKKALIPGAGTFTVDDITDPHNPTSGYVSHNGERIGLDNYVPNGTVSRFLRTIALCNNSKVSPASELFPEPSSEKKAAALDRTFSDDDRDTDGSTIMSVSRPPTAILQSLADGPWTAVGEPTEIALHVLAARFNMGKQDLLASLDIHLATEFSFDSTVKKMTVVYKDNLTGDLDVYSKGATEFMLPVLNITEQERDEILAAADAMANEGLRVLCIAHKPLAADSAYHNRADVESNLNYLGLVAIYDPPRLETKGAVRECKVAGITVHMLTGDHPGTARAIAKDVEIIDERTPASAVMIARDFDQMTDAQVDAMETLPLVIARCSPKTKVKMVQALHRRGRFCVMTGDGVNDSPALKQADVGMAMGTGSDVAKDAAEMVLTDDNFASIVKAVEEGRRLFDNIQKVCLNVKLHYHVTSNIIPSSSCISSSPTSPKSSYSLSDSPSRTTTTTLSSHSPQSRSSGSTSSPRPSSPLVLVWKNPKKTACSAHPTTSKRVSSPRNLSLISLSTDSSWAHYVSSPSPSSHMLVLEVVISAPAATRVLTTHAMLSIVHAQRLMLPSHSSCSSQLGKSNTSLAPYLICIPTPKPVRHPVYPSSLPSGAIASSSSLSLLDCAPCFLSSTFLSSMKRSSSMELLHGSGV